MLSSVSLRSSVGIGSNSQYLLDTFLITFAMSLSITAWNHSKVTLVGIFEISLGGVAPCDIDLLLPSMRAVQIFFSILEVKNLLKWCAMYWSEDVCGSGSSLFLPRRPLHSLKICLKSLLWSSGLYDRRIILHCPACLPPLFFDYRMLRT